MMLDVNIPVGACGPSFHVQAGYTGAPLLKPNLDAIADGMRAFASGGLSVSEQFMLSCDQAECPVIHHFGPGIYIRELHMKAGTMAIGHHQKHDHVNVLLKGRVLMLMDDGSTNEVAAPLMFVGKPGRKIGWVLEDMVWQNIYATTETDIETIEAMFLDKSEGFEQVRMAALLLAMEARDADRADYVSMLEQFGFSEQMVRSQSENEADQIGFQAGARRVKIGKSAIEGFGLFATADIQSGELIAQARIGGMRTPAGRYTNHAKNPNARMEMTPFGDINLVAIRSIKGCHGGMDGEEITIDYRQALALSGIENRKEFS